MNYEYFASKRNAVHQNTQSISQIQLSYGNNISLIYRVFESLNREKTIFIALLIGWIWFDFVLLNRLNAKNDHK